MTNSKKLFIIGLTIFLSAIILVVGMFYLQDISIKNSNYSFNVIFNETPGLYEGDDVKMFGKKIGVIHQLQQDGKTVTSVKVGQEVACSVQNITIGRQIAEEDVFYTLPSSSDARKLLNRFAQKLNSEERNTLNEIVEIQRKRDAAYGY